MQHILENKKMTLFFEGELNSFNADDVEKEIENIFKDIDVDAIVLDMEKLNYISSAGLRIIVRLKQRYNDVSLVKVPQGVYDIFTMVGFQNLFPIEKL